MAVHQIFATVNNLWAHGMPRYVIDPGHYLTSHFGFAVANDLCVHIKDVRGPHANTCRLQVSLALSQWQTLVHLVLAQDSALYTQVCDWAKEHGQRDFRAASVWSQVHWLERYWEACAKAPRRAVRAQGAGQDLAWATEFLPVSA